jgi:uncharacterized membrane protein
MPLLLAFAIGIVAGLRSMTAPAVVSWAAHLGWLSLESSSLAFMAAPATAYLLTIAAIGELVFDKLPSTPSRLTPVPLIARLVIGGLSGGAIAVAARGTLVAGVVCGGLGGIAGALAGYHFRRGLVTRFRLPDVAAALVEDAVTIAGAVLVVSCV